MKISASFLGKLVGSAFLLSGLAQAAMPICVRNVTNDQGLYICQKFSDAYAQVQPLSPEDKQVCTRIYADFYCNTAGEYARVRSLTKGVICVLNFNQPPVANYCSSVPQYYNYITANMED